MHIFFTQLLNSISYNVGQFNLLSILGFSVHNYTSVEGQYKLRPEAIFDGPKKSRIDPKLLFIARFVLIKFLTRFC